MKTIQLDRIENPDFSVLAINSHVKSYKICWSINKHLNTNFIKVKSHKVETNTIQFFDRFTFIDIKNDSQYDLVCNQSPSGYLLGSHKSVNYFLKIQNKLWQSEKQYFIDKLNEIPDILLIFELNLEKIKSLTPFILNDKQN